MALIECKDCEAKFSADATACPRCGAKPPKRTSMLGKVVAGVFALGVVGAVVQSTKGPAQRVAEPPNAPTQNAAASAYRPGKAVAALAKKVDQVEKTTWYRDRSSPQTLNSNAVFLYIGEQDKHAWLRMQIQFTADEWLFVNRAVFVVDGEKVGEATGQWERDNNARIFEWLDVAVGVDELPLVKRLAAAKEVLMRLEGRQYKRDRKLSAQELSAMRNVLAAYQELGGKL